MSSTLSKTATPRYVAAVMTVGGLILAVLAAWPWAPWWPLAVRILLAALYGLGAVDGAVLWIRVLPKALATAPPSIGARHERS
jgi:hypothetical protein